MHHSITRLISVFLVLCMMLTTTMAAEVNLTRGEACRLLLRYADDYNTVTATDIVRGYDDGSMREGQAISRVEAFVMISRAFGFLPNADTYWSTVSDTNAVFTDVPAWAAADIDLLAKVGLIAPAEDGRLRPYETMREHDFMLLLRRTFAFFGTNERDDFYSSISRDGLNNATFRPGNMMAGTIYDLREENNQRLQKMINTAIAANPEAGTPDHAIKALYTTFMDFGQRDKVGIAPIRPCLDAIDHAETIADLNKIQMEIQQKTGRSVLFGFLLTPSKTENGQYMLYFLLPHSAYGVDFYSDAKNRSAYSDYLTEIMMLAGQDRAAAVKTAALFSDYEQGLSKVEMTEKTRYNPKLAFNMFGWDALQAKVPTIKLGELAQISGLKPEKQVCIGDIAAMEYFSHTWTDENLLQAKAVLRCEIINQFEDLLGQNFYEAGRKFSRRLYGETTERTAEQRAISVVSEFLPDMLGKLYVQAYFSKEAKEDLTAMVRDMLQVYEQRIDKLSWMSDTTKALAKKKLATMSIHIGYPDQWSTACDNVKLKTAKEGGSYFENNCMLMQAYWRDMTAQQGKPVNQSDWNMSVYTVNAFYDFTNNSINFPAGILQAPFYKQSASRAENLGAIGTVIGHEISHAFDNNGAQYDEKGNKANWWTAVDYAAFEARCRAIADYYDGWEAMPGVTVSGTRTLSENIADIAGVSCALELLETKEKAVDYKKFFESFSKMWTMVSRPAFAEQVAATDIHAAANLRVNRVLSNFSQFYTAYGIDETDGLYVAPENRVGIW